MSEHLSITGPCDFFHMPMDEEGGFAFCHHCKKVKKALVIELHQGICSDYIQCICPLVYHRMYNTVIGINHIFNLW